MAGRIILYAITSQIAPSNPLVRHYSQRASQAAAQSAKVWKKSSKKTTLTGKKIQAAHPNETDVPTPPEIMKDNALLQDMIRFYKDSQKQSGK
ncbi:MAG: hypothetical protein JSS10_09700 [Verrucomicrobia bacterium]|nr:hypothetical protein [Verrucomicrobiota bacterium]